MVLSESVRALLPLRNSSHRSIVWGKDGVICEVFSGSSGIEAANEIQAFIVCAVNAHADLVESLTRIVSEYRANDLTIGAIEDAEEALAAAGAA